MCEQRKVPVPENTLLVDSGSVTVADCFTNFWNKNTLSVSSTLPVEILGSVYEAFLQKTIRLSRGGPRFEATHAVRKSGGVYYTPGYIVDYIVEETAGKLIAGKSPQETLGVRVLDPACGTGRFLIRMYDRILQEHRRWSEAHPGDARDAKPSDILANCIFGIDIDEVAVEVTRLSLYLKLMEDGASGAKTPDLLPHKDLQELASILAANVQNGDSLRPSRSEGFDVVLGNPPYGAELSAKMRAVLAKQFDAGTTETAALMMLHASRNLTRSGGVNGFIVPKAFTYSSNWKKVRTELLGDMTSLVDVGKVWPEVRLEQVIYLLQKDSSRKGYANLRRDGGRFENVAVIKKQHCEGFGFLLNGISREELEVGLRIQNAGSFLSEYVSNTRGANFQEQVSSRKRTRRVIGGKQIQRFQIVEEKGFVSSASLDKNAFVAPGSILVQNIIAHIGKPVDHIKIAAAVAGGELTKEIVILDTVNQLSNRSRVSPYFFCALLNSRLMNWYVYRFIYAKAVRTMHFDGPVTARIPVPRITRENKSLYEEIVRGAKRSEGSETLEAAVYGLYGLAAEEVGVVERGMRG